MNLSSGMAALQAFNNKAIGFIPFRNILEFDRQVALCILPAGTATYTTPSSSESRFISIRESTIDESSSRAPVSPVSSSTVSRTSTGPSFSSDSSTARPAATATPLSAPRVVPSAFSQPSSITRAIGLYRNHEPCHGSFHRPYPYVPAEQRTGYFPYRRSRLFMTTFPILSIL